MVWKPRLILVLPTRQLIYDTLWYGGWTKILHVIMHFDNINRSSFTISTVAEVCASTVWLKGIFLLRDLGISWGHKWRTQFVSFMFRTRWARGHLGGRPVFKTPEMLDAQIFLDYLTWTDGMSRFLTVGIQLYIFKHLTTFLRIIKLAVMVGTDVQVNLLCFRSKPLRPQPGYTHRTVLFDGLQSAKVP